jgi:isoleucyl-tRNA synthetase
MFNIIDIETNIQKFWLIDDTRKRYLNQRYFVKNIYNSNIFECGNGNDFNITDGPPFATGTPHFGHLLANSIKDCIIRYKTLCGFNIDKTPGWDCHGVPIEINVNKKLNILSKDDIDNKDKIGIEKYCQECKENVSGSMKDWAEIMDRFARWAKYESAYTTMDFRFCQTVWKMFNILYQQNMITLGYCASHYSLPLETSLSYFESSQNFIEKEELAITFRLKITEKINNESFQNMTCYIAVFHTSLWTLPGNCAIAINKNAYYYPIICNNKKNATFYCINKNLKKIIKSFDKNLIIPGSLLLNLKYENLFDFYTKFTTSNNFNKIYHANFVDYDFGTGFVSISPKYGENDFNFITNNNLNSDFNFDFDYLNNKGEFTNEIGNYFIDNYYLKSKISCFDFNIHILNFIKNNKINNFISQEIFKHQYPHCWRTNTPLIHKVLLSWKVKVSNFKNDLVDINKKINWFPHHVGKNKFNNWLKNAKDWNISRSRYWGTPLPVWKKIEDAGLNINNNNSDNKNDFIIIESARQLEELCKLPKYSITDLHRDKIDDLIISFPNGTKYKRIPEVFDCWFESGSVPLFFSDTEYKPCDFISEGQDQTRGWFYTLLILGYACLKYYKISLAIPPFKNVVVSGLVLSKDKKKMSKSSKNYINPNDIIQKYGADALRLYLLKSPASQSNDFVFDENNIIQMSKQILFPLLHSINFLKTYINYNYYNLKFINIKYNKIPNINNIKNNMNIWILYNIYMVEKNIHDDYKKYKINDIISKIIVFIQKLNNTYIQLMRPIFQNKIKQEFLKENINESINTLNFVLLRLSYLLAPISPFIAEYIFQNTKDFYEIFKNQTSIHLVKYSDFYREFEQNYSYDKTFIHKSKIIDTQLEILNLIRKLRAKYNIPKSKILNNIIIISDLTQSSQNLSLYLTDEIKYDINSKNISFLQNNQDLNINLYSEKTKNIKIYIDTSSQNDNTFIIQNIKRHFQKLKKKNNLQYDKKYQYFIKTTNQTIINSLENETQIKLYNINHFNNIHNYLAASDRVNIYINSETKEFITINILIYSKITNITNT